MCNKEDCQHEQQIIITDRDIMVGKAFMATMFMRLIMGLKNNDDVADWMVQAGACAIDCNNADCGTTRTMLAALTQAIDHVDNGADLEVADLYTRAGLLSAGKAPSTADKLTQILKRAGIDLDQFPDTDDEGVIDTVIVDPIPSFIDVSSDSGSVPREIGRMVGADRGRSSATILVGGPKRTTEQLH